VDTPRHAISDWKLEGGHLALDFVNTVGGLRDEPPSREDELFTNFENVLGWCARLGVVSERDARRLQAEARRDDRGAQRALTDARALRELIYAVFRPIAEGGEPPAELLERVREAERDALADARLAPADGAMEWTWPAPDELTDVLKPIVHAAVELLTTGPLDRVKVCGNCRWIFLDQSRNHSRRWCSMEECGTQLKHRRFVERRRRQRVA
jgi:predicted RNA-binding Zn ribbon-like protein